MSKRHAYTFRCPEPMQKALDEMMLNLNLDRTSVIKLAMYSFYTTLQHPEMKGKSPLDLVEIIEKKRQSEVMNFNDFIQG